MPTFVTRPGLHVEAAQPDPSLDVWSVEAGDLPPFALPGDRFRALFEPVESVPAAVDPNPPDLTALWYSDPADAWAVMHEVAASVAGLPVEDLPPIVTRLGEDGEVSTPSAEVLLSEVREYGCWAFLDARTQTIHAWVDPDADIGLVVHMMGHQVGAAVSRVPRDDLDLDARAELFAQVALAAFSLAHEGLQDARRYAEDGEGS